MSSVLPRHEALSLCSLHSPIQLNGVRILQKRLFSVLTAETEKLAPDNVGRGSAARGASSENHRCYAKRSSSSSREARSCLFNRVKTRSHYTAYCVTIPLRARLVCHGLGGVQRSLAVGWVGAVQPPPPTTPPHPHASLRYSSSCWLASRPNRST